MREKREPSEKGKNGKGSNGREEKSQATPLLALMPPQLLLPAGQLEWLL